MFELPTSFTDIISLVSFAAGVFSGVATFLARARAARELEKAQAAVDEKRTDQALKSDDLQVLGRYLYDELGSVTLANYARDVNVQGRLDHVVRRVASFVEPGDEEREVSREPATPIRFQQWPPENVASLIRRHGLQKAEQQIRAGNVWNGLAELRRQVEVRLRQIARHHDLPVERVGARRLLNSLIARGVVPEQSRTPFDYAINVANRGVHGEEVSNYEAMEALLAAVSALEHLPSGDQHGPIN